MLTKAGAVFDRLITIMAYGCCVLLALPVIFITIDVAMRFFFNRPMGWTLETSEYILMIITFMASAWVLKKERHVSIDSAIIVLKPKAQSITNGITSLVCAAACGILTWFGTTNVIYHFQAGTVVNQKSTEMPLAPVLMFLPLGFLLLTIQFLRRAGVHFTRSAMPIEATGKHIDESGF